MYIKDRANLSRNEKIVNELLGSNRTNVPFFILNFKKYQKSLKNVIHRVFDFHLKNMSRKSAKMFLPKKCKNFQ